MYAVHMMKPRTICLPDQQVDALKEYAAKKGITYSELLRRIIDLWLDGEKQ